jgi:uncharacterized protein YvpB
MSHVKSCTESAVSQKASSLQSKLCFLLDQSLQLCAGLLSLQSLRVEGNKIKQDLDIRTLAALPNLRHLGLAGNPVMADMDFSQQRAFLVDLMPGMVIAMTI